MLDENALVEVNKELYINEFANIGKIPDFECKLATMQSRDISAIDIFQNLDELKGMNKDEVWKTIYSNCDTTNFLGANVYSSLEYQSKNISNKSKTIDNVKER